MTEGAKINDPRIGRMWSCRRRLGRQMDLDGARRLASDKGGMKLWTVIRKARSFES